MQTFIIILMILLIIVLIYIIKNLYNKTEVLNNIISQQQDIQADVLLRMENTIEELKQIDLRGAFESDDEVGFTWKNLKEIITILNNDIIDAFNNKDAQYGKKKNETKE